jgi:hypothetical protein
VAEGLNRSAAERIVAAKDELAGALTAALYADMPQLLEKYGERGRLRCAEDMRFNLEHLAPAVGLAQPALFAGYVQWLAELLRARNVGTDEVARSLELMKVLLRERLPAGEANAAATCIDAGLQTLAPR